ncbi:MAG: hypothetical protein KC561_13635, partial [Myxococcales bacterium]|nr:hypothetical protein [Myxococcales bacterium]
MIDDLLLCGAPLALLFSSGWGVAIEIAVLVFSIIGISLASRGRRHDARALVDSACEAFGLQFESREANDREARGQFEGHDVRLVDGDLDQTGRRLLQVTLSGKMGKGVTIDRRSLTDSPGAEPKNRILTGDADFDRHFTVRGDRGQALALLSRPARVILLKGEGLGFLFTNGELCWSGGQAGAKQLHEVLEITREAASALFSGTKHERLLESLSHDPIPSFRMQCLRFLLGSDRDAAIAEAIRIGLADTDRRLQIVAAGHSQDKAGELLKALEDGTTEEQSLAVEMLGVQEHLGDSSKVAKRMLRAARASDYGPVIAAVLDMVREKGLPVSRSELEPFVGHRETDVARALAELAGVSDLQLEDLLIRDLGRAGLPARTCRAIISVLATKGSVASVPVLRQCTDPARYSERVRSAAASAIVQIQAQLGDLERGGLSVSSATHDSGGLTVSDSAS